MSEPPIPLPVSAYVMAVISAVFVFFGGSFVGGAGMMLMHDRFEWPVGTLIVAAPLVLISSVMLGCLSAWESIEQSRKKAQLASAALPFDVTCEGCGEGYLSAAPHCPVCGRKAVRAV